jgi:putative NADH-flavin reductase
VDRGHTVLSVSRSVAADRVPGATYVEGTLLDIPGLVAQLEGADVVVSAVAPRGDGGLVRPNLEALNTVLPRACGWASSAAPAAASSPRRPSRRRRRLPRRLQGRGAGDDRRAGGPAGRADRSRLVLRPPAGGFGGFNPGERTGTYRVGGDVIVTDAEGQSYISGADLAVAVLDEIENPQHSRRRFTVGY